MTQVPVHDGPLNSGAINHTQFPGTEAGKSIINLVGTVEAACSLSSIYLLKTASASVEPSAVTGSASTFVRAQLSASTSAQAGATSGAVTELGTVPSAQSAAALTAAVVLVKQRVFASAIGVATVSTINGYPRADRAAAVSAYADAQAFALRGIPLSATTKARAVEFASALRKPTRSAATAATANAVATPALLHGVPASGISLATGVATTRVNVRRGASTTGFAVGSAPIAGRNVLVGLSPLSAFAGTQGASERHYKTNSAAAAGVAAVDANAAFKFNLAASTTAQAIAESAAADYALASPAPVERLMTVPASDRRMEVTL
jgi:hypothetical protein